MGVARRSLSLLTLMADSAYGAVASVSASAGGAFKDSAWKEDLCGCMNDMESCLCSCILPCVQFGRNQQALTGEDWIMPCALYMLFSAVGFPCIYGGIGRGKVRSTYDIKGDQVNDIICHWCCACCSLAQEAREIKARGGTFKPAD